MPHSSFSIALGQASPGKPLPLVSKWPARSRTTGSQLGHGRRTGWVPDHDDDDGDGGGDVPLVIAYLYNHHHHHHQVV